MDAEKAELIVIGKRIQEALEVDIDATAQIRAARAGLIDRVALRNAAGLRHGWLGRSWARHPGAWAALAATAVVLASGWLWLRVPISFQVGAQGTNGRLGDEVEAVGSEPVALDFSEGSSILLHSGGRLRVLSAEPSGARVLIETGRLDVSITHATARPTRWNFEAGPFHVLVVGTKFTLAWAPQTQTFDLATQEGSVRVSGACLGAERTVGGGDRVHLSCLTRPATPEPRSELPPPSAGPAEARASAVAAPASIETTRADESWRALIAAGRLADAFRAAERADFSRVCRSAGDKELLALADAARFSGHPGRAVEALTVLRQRFPHSVSAATAAFALGRLAFDGRGAYTEAARWFATYLDEAPNGPLMGDAVGRLMEARHRQGDRQGARLDAERYLRRFPEGPYASQARGILSE